jgi:hypothetical protein
MVGPNNKNSGHVTKRLSFISHLFFEFTAQGHGNGSQSLCLVRHTLRPTLVLLQQDPKG